MLLSPLAEGALDAASCLLRCAGLSFAVSMPVAASAGSGQHAAITITANSDFTAPGSPAGCACVTAGNGTPGNPYVIGPWAITAPSQGSSGWAVKIDNTSGAVTSSFTITGISANYSGVPFTDPVIVLADVNNPSGTTVSNVSANGDGRGVELDSSSYVTLDQPEIAGRALFPAIGPVAYVCLDLDPEGGWA